MLKDLLSGYPPWVALPIALATALAVAYFVAEVVARGARVLIVRFVEGVNQVPFSAPIVRRPVRAVRVAVFLLAATVLVFPALKVAGVDLHVGVEPEALADWVLSSGLRIVMILALTTVVMKAVAMALQRVEEEMALVRDRDSQERAKRVRTLSTLVANVVGVLASMTALLMILRELNIDIMPLLTGAGIVGLAVGFGAQTLVKDVISGFFIILENQVRVGDVVVINGTGGVVESIQIRTMTLRDIHGTVHVFPNGSIATLANQSKDFAYAVLDVSVAYKADLDEVYEALRAVDAGLRADPRYRDALLEPLEIFGVDALAESGVTVRMRSKTIPLKQFEVAREFRRRIKLEFEARGIEIPFPQRTVHVVGR